MSEQLPEQLPILIHQPNFRDIGGVLTTDGRRVKSGLLYRSGDLSRLSGEDLLRIGKIGIRMIIDFRADRELLLHPTPHLETVEEVKRFIIPDSARDRAEQMLKEGDSSGLEMILVQDYRRMVRDHLDEFRNFFSLLAVTNLLPLIYHCAAGKDRTGLATYLLLVALGVSEENALKDYLLSNTFLKPVAERYIREAKKSGHMHAEILRPLLEVREEYLEAALDEIKIQFKTMDKFLTDGLHVDRLSLRRKYLN